MDTPGSGFDPRIWASFVSPSPTWNGPLRSRYDTPPREFTLGSGPRSYSNPNFDKYNPISRSEILQAMGERRANLSSITRRLDFSRGFHNFLSARKKNMPRKRAAIKVKGYGAGSAEKKEAMKHIAVFRNPFSNASLTPRIPDGKAITSQGLKFNLRAEFDVDVAGTRVFLQPAAICPAFYSTVPTAAAPSPRHWAFVNKQLHNYQVTTSTENPDKTFTQPSTTAIHKWRVVSYGLHVSLLNNTDSNDGWWEAFRLNTSKNPEYWDVGYNLTDPTAVTPFVISTDNKLDLTTENVTNLPSYTTGLLRDIKNVEFSLHPDGCEHDFKESPGTIALQDADVKTYANSGEGELKIIDSAATFTAHRIQKSSGASKEFIDAMVDDGYDTICVHLHGRTSAEVKTRVLVHIVQNIEVVYDDRAINARFHTRTPIHSGFEKITKNKAKKTEAATPLK